MSELSGQYNGTSGHLVETIKNWYSLIKMIKGGPSDEEGGHAKSERNFKIEI